MLSEKKIRLMTKLALFEEKNGKKAISSSKYYKSDYVGLNMINSFIVATLAYILIIGCIIFVNIEEFIASVASIDFLNVGRVIIISFILYMILYMAIAYIVYSVKYNNMAVDLKKYDGNLRELYQVYKEEENEALSKTGTIDISMMEEEENA